MINQKHIGAITGGMSGAANGLMIASSITWGAIFDTIVFTGVGTIVGFFGTLFLKWIWEKIKTKPKVEGQNTTTMPPVEQGGVPTTTSCHAYYLQNLGSQKVSGTYVQCDGTMSGFSLDVGDEATLPCTRENSVRYEGGSLQIMTMSDC